MIPQSYKVKISSIRPLTAEVFELILQLVDPPNLQFQPGQAIAITVPSSSSSKFPVRRYYSLASPPSSLGTLCLLFKKGEQGIGSQFLRNHTVGEELVVEGPFGSFCLQEDPGRELLFVATGTGIAPIRSMLVALLERGTSQPCSLLWGLRRESDIYYLEEFERLAAQHPQFSFILTLSQGGRDWLGHKGRVTHFLERFSQVDRLAVYVCGSRRMVTEVIGLLRQRGVSRLYREHHHGET